jgi:hypothetical protein
MAVDYTRRPAPRVEYVHPTRPRSNPTPDPLTGTIILRRGESIVLR